MNRWMYKVRSNHQGNVNDFVSMSLRFLWKHRFWCFWLQNQYLCMTWTYYLVLTVVLPPEKAEGCESYLQYQHSEDGEREIIRDANKAPGKKRISLDVRSPMICQHRKSVLWLNFQLHHDSKAYYMSCVHWGAAYSKKMQSSNIEPML